ncbi:MAG: glycosyltransferase, partial [bacterium]
MSAAPRVTVIMPTYDRAAYLGDAIGSVLAQRFVDFELIVVDDGSTDATPALLAAVRDPRLRVLQQAHRGISAAMNAGLRAARGAYVARLDSDDRWHDEMLQAAVALLDTQPDVDVVYAKGQAMTAAGVPLPHTVGAPPRFAGDALRSMVFDDFTCNVATVARLTCVVRAGGYDEALMANEDWDLWLRVARGARFAFLDRVLAHFCWHDDNLTGPASPVFRAVLASRTAPLDKLFAQADLPPQVAAMRAVAYENVALFRG